jgi:hypothetical protein
VGGYFKFDLFINNLINSLDMNNPPISMGGIQFG